MNTTKVVFSEKQREIHANNVSKNCAVIAKRKGKTIAVIVWLPFQDKWYAKYYDDNGFDRVDCFSEYEQITGLYGCEFHVLD